MGTDVRAIIRWMPPDRGGRSAPPRSAVGYSTLARFESERGHEAWSIIITHAVEIDDAGVIDARVRFLVPEAPHELLQVGERFSLREGHKVSAKAVAIPDSMPCPDHLSEFELALLG
jgi:hypothetical protein